MHILLGTYLLKILAAITLFAATMAAAFINLCWSIKPYTHKTLKVLYSRTTNQKLTTLYINKPFFASPMRFALFRHKGQQIILP